MVDRPFSLVAFLLSCDVLQQLQACMYVRTYVHTCIASASKCVYGPLSPPPPPHTMVFHSVTQLCGVYKEGEVQFDSAWLYLAMINSLSQGVSASTWWVDGWVGTRVCFHYTCCANVVSEARKYCIAMNVRLVLL